MHIMHHSSNTNAQTHSCNYYSPIDNKNDRFRCRSKFLPGVHIAHSIICKFVRTFQYKCNTPCSDHSGNFISCCWSSRTAQCQWQTHQHIFGCIQTVLHWKVLNIFFNVWESKGEKTLSTFLHSSWGRGCVNLDRPSWGRELMCETIPTFVANT